MRAAPTGGTFPGMRYVIVDLEATCWEGGGHADRMETIEIGAVLLPSAGGAPLSEFGRFVRPVASPRLSAFCTSLTSIRQADVDGAEVFWSVFQDFMAWIGPDPFVWCSWGAYDKGQLERDCRRHGLAFPASLARHINLKTAFAAVFNVRSCGMVKALAHARLPLTGTHHRGLDDARNIAKLAALVLPRLEQEGAVP